MYKSKLSRYLGTGIALFSLGTSISCATMSKNVKKPAEPYTVEQFEGEAEAYRGLCEREKEELREAKCAAKVLELLEGYHKMSPEERKKFLKKYEECISGKRRTGGYCQEGGALGCIDGD